MGEGLHGMQWYMAATYIGAIVGAGFASGQEALKFFVAYGTWGLLGVVLVTIGFAFMGALSFATAQEARVESYKQLLEITCGSRWARYYDIVITCFLLAGVGVMLAGAGSLVNQQWGIHPLMGVLVTALIAGISCCRGIDGVFYLNALLVPGILLATMALGMFGLVDLTPRLWNSGTTALWIVAPSPLVPNWWSAAIVYLSYNSLLGIAACTPLAASLNQKKAAAQGGLVGGVALGLLLLCGSLAIWGMGLQTTEAPVPMAWIATHLHPLAGSPYGIIIWSAMLTTAATNLFAVVKRLGRTPNPAILTVLLGLAFALSLLGFSALIELLYPLFGYLGAVYIVQMLTFFWRRGSVGA